MDPWGGGTIYIYMYIYCTDLCIQSYMHACMHTYIHTYIHSYIYIYRERERENKRKRERERERKRDRYAWCNARRLRRRPHPPAHPSPLGLRFFPPRNDWWTLLRRSEVCLRCSVVSPCSVAWLVPIFRMFWLFPAQCVWFEVGTCFGCLVCFLGSCFATRSWFAI